MIFRYTHVYTWILIFKFFTHYLTRVTWRVTCDITAKFPTNTGQRYVETDCSTLKITSKTFQENYDKHSNTNTCTCGDTVLYIHAQGSKISIQLSTPYGVVK